MLEDAADYFAFLANSYLAEPTPENARRLWQSLFALEGLYFLLRPMGGEQVPAIAVQDGQPYLLIWTDLASLRAYVAETQTPEQADSGSEEQYLLVPMEQVVEHIFRYPEYGITGVRFNPPLGWSVPFERLRLVAQHFGVV